MDLAIRTTIRTELNIKPDAEVVDMCEAIRQMMESSKQQGMQQGMQKGIQQGIQQGMQRGMQQGIQQGMQQGIQQGMQQGMQRGSREMQLQIARELLSMHMSA